MKKITKKLLAIMLVLSIVLALFPLTIITASAATSITISTFQTKYDKFKKNVYADGSKYVNDPGNTGGYECFGYANEIAKYIYGSYPTSSGSAISNINSNWSIIRGTSAINSLHVGDIVRYRQSNSYDHSIFVYKIDGNNVYYTDANAGSSYNIVASRKTTKSDLTSKIGSKLVGNSDVVGYVAHYKGWIDTYTLTIEYNINGGTIDNQIIGYRYTVVTDVGLNLRSAAGTGSSVIKTLAKGTTFDINSSDATKTANGYVWGKTTVGNNTGWIVISDSDLAKKGNAIRNPDYYSKSSIVYKSSSASVYQQSWNYGSGGANGLVNAKTLGLKRTGYTFKGWSVSTDGSTVIFDEDDTSLKAENINPNVKNSNQKTTLNAIWQPNNLSVYYNANGGSINSDTYKLSDNLVYNKSDNTRYEQKWTYNDAKSNGLVNVGAFGISRTGYKFAGWGTSASGGTIFDQDNSDLLPTNINPDIKTGNATRTLYAIWNPITYDVKYNANGGTSAPSAQTKTYGIDLTLSSAKPTRSGYTFKGWATSATATSAIYNSGAKYTDNESVTLYAVWQANTYQVTFNANGGTSAPSAQTKTYGTDLTLSSAKPTRSGYTFKGWATSATATSATYNSGAKYTDNKSVTLYAVWEKNADPIPEHTHIWDTEYTVDIEPTCTEKGVKSIHCKTCGETKSITEIPANGHNYIDVIMQEATCTHTGLTVKRCSVCGDDGEVAAVPVIEHKYQKVILSEATCENAGVMADVCSECGHQTNTEIINKLEHVFNDWVITEEATEDANGSEERVCMLCGYSETREIEFVPENPITPIDETEPYMWLESKNARSGDTIAVNIAIQNNPGLAYLKLALDYDSSALELISATNVGLLSGTYTTSKTTDVIPYIIQWMGAENSTGDGEILTLNFKVKDSAIMGIYTIGVTFIEAYNEDYEDVAIAIQNGSVKVQDEIIGDLNGDELINGKDGIICSQALAGWDITYSELAADVNGDGVFNGKDGILLSQYLAGWDVVLG